MRHSAPRIALVAAALVAALLMALPHGRAQRAAVLMEPAEARAELARATRESRLAAARAARLAAEAEAAEAASERTARETAALAARIQQAEAEIGAARARATLARAQRTALSARLARQQEPTARLAAALQTAARRPVMLSVLQPGALSDVVHLRAVLGAAVPAIRARTAGLRADLARGRLLEARAAAALEDLNASETMLRERRAELAQRGAGQQLAERAARGNAAREAERALALGEAARDLDGLMAGLETIAALRRELEALPGPVLRPGNLAADLPSTAPTRTAAAAPPPRTPRALRIQLPVLGRTLAGFGIPRTGGLPTTGVMLAPAAGAQVVAPASGRVAFAGPYRGFGRIVIIEHPGGWTSLVTGLAQTSVAVGETLIGGAPLGVVGGGEVPVSFELRRAGEPVNPLQFVG